MNAEAIIKGLEQTQIKKNVADVRVGDTVKVHYKIREGNKERIQIFEGLVIDTKNGKNLQGSFIARKVVAGIGVERTFPLHSPWIVKIERVKTGKVRRARLNYVRKYATSSRFKLKDKGKEGTIWEDIAEQQEQAEEARIETEEQIENTVAEPTAEEESATDETPKAEEVEAPAVEETAQTDKNVADDVSEQEVRESGGEVSASTPAEEVQSPSDKSSN
ncbi:50S ribosomal protein L19 [Candidatus Berkelbacteria bacterium]|nr:50S ribosomal protein L19 [Candidatus Berkelbacteria bacterium]